MKIDGGMSPQTEHPKLREIRLTQEVESLCAVGKWQECIDICDRPNVLPTSGLFYVHLASACVQCQNYDAANMSINIALGLDASSHQALHIRGMLRQLKGDFLGAMRDYQGWASWMDLTCAEAQQLIEACNMEDRRFPYLGGVGMNAALLSVEDAKAHQQLLARYLAEFHAAKQCAARLEGSTGLSRQWELEQSMQLLQKNIFADSSKVQQQHFRASGHTKRLEPICPEFSDSSITILEFMLTRLIYRQN
ncbi:hypothetical protein WJX82_010721 [Trebouxia sp. C0006]